MSLVLQSRITSRRDRNIDPADECTNCGRCLRFARRALPGRRLKADLRIAACAWPVSLRPKPVRPRPGLYRPKSNPESCAFYYPAGCGVLSRLGRRRHPFSGGEPLAQPEFAGALIDGCRALGIGVVIETCGCFDWTRGREIIEKAEQVFLDLKHMDPAQHHRLTGAGNELILKNAVRIAETNTPLIIRIPVIPTLNDSIENISNTAEFVHQHLPSGPGNRADALSPVGFE